MVSGTGNSAPLIPEFRALIDAFNGTDIFSADNWVELVVDGLYVIANVEEVAERLRIRVYLPADDEELVKDWVARQPAPRSGLLQASYIDEGEWRPRLVFERPTGSHSWSDDPLFDDVDRYHVAWLDDTEVPQVPGSRPPYLVPDDPRVLPPESAWLLKGSEASYPTADELRNDRAAAQVGIFTWDWTTASQTQVGDLVLFYFMAPRKAVHFVARAASKAFFSRDIAVNADGRVNNAQWWGYFTTPIEIEPVPLDTLREAVGGYLPLRGRSGLYLRPAAIEALHLRAADPAQQSELQRVVSVPVGLADLPTPAEVTFPVWRDLAAGALRLEADVSTYIVEPLLRDMLHGTGLKWKSEYQVGRRWADFVILDGESPVHVIEVKKVIKQSPHRDWRESADFAQLRWYAEQLRVPGTLIDSHLVLLIKRGADEPYREVTRRSVSIDDLEAIRRHLTDL